LDDDVGHLAINHVVIRRRLMAAGARHSCRPSRREQTVAHLGERDERGRIEARALASILTTLPNGARLFDGGGERLSALAIATASARPGRHDPAKMATVLVGGAVLRAVERHVAEDRRTVLGARVGWPIV
jgi:hypothetical protein